MTAYISKQRNGMGHAKNMSSVLLSESEYFCFYASFNAVPTGFKPACGQGNSAIYWYCMVFTPHDFFYGIYDHTCKRIIHYQAVGLVWISGSVPLGAAQGTCTYPLVILAVSLVTAML